MPYPLRVVELLNAKEASDSVKIGGWVRSKRDSKGFSFIDLNDGSCLKNLQVIINDDTPAYAHLDKISTGASVSIEGALIESPGKNQSYELRAQNLTVLGQADPESYPLQKKRHSAEFLRDIAHLRSRTNLQGAVLRVRSALSIAIHDFYQKHGFQYVHTPIITGSDCEGAGEMFAVTTLPLDGSAPKSKETGKIDYTEDFFGRPTHLTVSGQLDAELLAMGLGRVYTFGPTFRAENSNTARHAAEFWMVEPEAAFFDLNDTMNLAEDFVQSIIKSVLEACPEDMQLFNKFVEKGKVDQLQKIVDAKFKRLSYTEAVQVLQDSKKKFEFKVEWGIDLQTEHERFLTENIYKCPVVVYDYPKTIKSFYMRNNDDGKTVAAMDVLVPGVGELIGGSQREERYELLKDRMLEMGLSEKEYWWYLDIRKFGTVPHSGFGLGFERMLMLLTGVSNIRDVIPFPRTPKSADF